MLPVAPDSWQTIPRILFKPALISLRCPRLCTNRTIGFIYGEWQGRMAERYGLAGAIDEQHFARLSEGQNPLTGEQLVRHRNGQEYTTADGITVKPVEHRAGWDATFSAPKSVSLTALVGGDDRVREAHRQAVTTALTQLV